MTETQIYINKTLAAQRQIRCAIRLFFLGEEPLAVHALTSSATSLCNDILESRGRDLLSEVRSFGAARFSHDYVRGLLTPDQAELAKQIERSSPEIFDLFRKHPDLRISDIVSDTKLPKQEINSFWANQRKIWNFIKHANRDSESHISLSNIDNVEDVWWALGAYNAVIEDIIEEGRAFLCFTHFYHKIYRYENVAAHEPYYTYFEELDEITAKMTCFLWLSLNRDCSFYSRLHQSLAAVKDDDMRSRIRERLQRKGHLATDATGGKI
jgi:hypothetical protein